MTNKQFVEIEKKLAPHLPGFQVRGALMVLSPIEHLLRAINFERSSSKDAFYAWRFVMPLCVPHDYISFGFGDRLRDSQNRGGVAWFSA